DGRQHTVLIRPPCGEPRQIVIHLSRVGVKNMRTVFVNENAGLVVMVVRVSPDVGTAIANQHLLSGISRETLCDGCSGKAGADDKIIEHGSPISWLPPPVRRRSATRRERHRA